MNIDKVNNIDKTSTIYKTILQIIWISCLLHKK